MAIRSNDVRGASAKDIKKDLDKVQVGKPVFLIFLRAEDSHAYLNPNAEVGKRFFYYENPKFLHENSNFLCVQKILKLRLVRVCRR